MKGVTSMLNFLCILLVALFASLPMAATVHPQNTALAATFEDDGYTGAWVESKGLSIEVFLPEGWSGEDRSDSEGPYFSAAGDKVALEVHPESEKVSDLVKQSSDPQGNLTFESAQANGLDAALARRADGLTVVVPCGPKAYRFDFHFDAPEALSESMALRIAGSCTDLW